MYCGTVYYALIGSRWLLRKWLMKSLRNLQEIVTCETVSNFCLGDFVQNDLRHKISMYRDLACVICATISLVILRTIAKV